LLISIITVNLNNSKGLQKTIESVLNQTYKEFEYIVIDGGSTDDSVNIIQQYANQLTFWVSEKDNGIYHAMNKGWQKATGQYCLFLNSGDYLFARNVLEKVSMKMSEQTADIYFGDLELENGRNTYIDKFHIQPSLYFLSYSYFPHPTAFISTKLLVELGGYDEHYKIIADRVFFTTAVLKGKTFQPLYLTVTHFEGNGLTSKGLETHQKERYELITKEFPFLEKENKHFKRLRHYDISRPHQLLNKLLSLFGKGMNY
jgi:glycosyltransferase involved in cell wall biosynthesis